MSFVVEKTRDEGRRAGITYEGAFHNTMNRGINEEEIFIGPENKNQFLDYLAEKSKYFKAGINPL